MEMAWYPPCWPAPTVVAAAGARHFHDLEWVRMPENVSLQDLRLQADLGCAGEDVPFDVVGEVMLDNGWPISIFETRPGTLDEAELLLIGKISSTPLVVT